MTKSELIDSVAQRSGVPKASVEKAFKALGEEVTHALIRGDEVLVADSVRLKVVTRAAREGRNPATGESMKFPAKSVVKGKVMPSLLKAVAEKVKAV